MLQSTAMETSSLARRSWSHSTLRWKLLSLLALSAMGLAAQPVRADVLEYWDFNNDSATFSSSNGSLGVLYNTGSAANKNNGYGEKYDTTLNTISSNSGSGAIFSNGSIDMSGVTVPAGDANGGNTSLPQAWGLLLNSSLPDQLPGDLTSGASTTGGALVILGNSSASDTVVFSLSSLGYQNLTLNLDSRPGSTLSVDPTVTWAYSLDDSSWTSFSMTGNRVAGTWSLLSGSLSPSLDNLSTFYVRETLVFPSTAGSFAIDNVELSGSQILAAPEPGTWALLLSGLGALFWIQRIRSARKI